jgi:hypothetical protein
MSPPHHPQSLLRIEVLYCEGCPGTAQMLPDLRALAKTVHASLELHPIETPEQAEVARFLGSPTVRVDGRDVETGTEQRADYGIKCRLYPDQVGVARIPRAEPHPRPLAHPRSYERSAHPT